MPNRYRQLRVKVPTFWLEWDLNLQPSGRKATNLPLSHQAPLTFKMSQNSIFHCFSSTWISNGPHLRFAFLRDLVRVEMFFNNSDGH